MALHQKLSESQSWTRRRFVQIGAATAIGANLSSIAQAESAPSTMIDVPFEKREPRIAIVGTGGRGTVLLQNLLAADARIVALCDIVSDKAEHAASLVTAAGQRSRRICGSGLQVTQRTSETSLQTPVEMPRLA